jgi:uncharacterized protein (TIGR03437 family)
LPQNVTITAALHGSSANTSISIAATGSQVSVDISGAPTSVDGEAVGFQVFAHGPENLPVTLSASGLPAGSRFDASTGEFSWEPGKAKPGAYPVVFTAANSAGQSGSATVAVAVVSGKPILTKLIQAASRSSEGACSPGSMAILEGVGLGKNLAGEEVRISVNDQAVTAIGGSMSEIVFPCPALAPGVPLRIQAQRGERSSNVLTSVMAEAAPGVFSLDHTGSGQGAAVLNGTGNVLMQRSPEPLSQPATRGDTVSILATGLGVDVANAPDRLEVWMGNAVTYAQSVTLRSPGAWEVIATVPEGTTLGDAVPLQLQLTLSEGRVAKSNLVTIAIESRGEQDR